MDQILEVKDSLMNEEFESLADSRERVDYTFEKLGSIENLRQNVQKYLSEHKTENMKSVVKSQELRQKGNLFFEKKNYEYALYYYNSAVLWAPYPQETGDDSDHELTYAFTARSLTLFEMKAYENALFDVNCALNLSEFTMKFTERLQLMTHKIYCLCRLRRYYTAMAVVSAVIQLVPCLPINNYTVSSLIKIKDQIIEKISEEESEDVKQTQTDGDLIEQHLKNVEIFLSPEIKLIETEAKGRHYTAVEPIPIGKLIVVEKAITTTLFKPHFTTHCQNCLKNVGYKCWPCSGCSQVVFCNQECADNAYHHKYECGFTDILHDLGTNHHLIYRIILLVGPQKAIELAKEETNQSDESNEVSGDEDREKVNYLKFLQLVDHRNKYCLKTKIPSIFKSIQMSLIFDFFEEFRPKDRLIEDFLRELSALLDTFNYKAFVNVFGIYEHIDKKLAFRGGHIGNALMYSSSFFNHSCSPNMYWVFNGNHISLVSTANIEKGEELNISYGPYSKCMAFEERQAFLKRRYFFQCNCKTCLSDAKSLPTLKCNDCSDGFFIYKKDSPKSSCVCCGKTMDISSAVRIVEQTSESFDYWINQFKNDNNELTLIRAERCYHNFDEYLYPKSKKLMEIHSKLSRYFENVGLYSKAMEYSKKILESMADKDSLHFCTEMVFYSRVYYHYLYKQRKILTIDDEWKKCFKILSETLVFLNDFKSKLVTALTSKSNEKTDEEYIKGVIQMIDGCLKSKEQQIRIISKMIDNSTHEPMDQ